MHMMRLEVAYQASVVEKVTGQPGGDLECGGEVKKDPVDARVPQDDAAAQSAWRKPVRGPDDRFQEPQQLFEE